MASNEGHMPSNCWVRKHTMEGDFDRCRKREKLQKHLSNKNGPILVMQVYLQQKRRVSLLIS